jgi:U3 small nucleolar RNA-associated protein 13
MILEEENNYPDEDDEIIHQEDDDNENARQKEAMFLSKSWAISKAHVPTYTGGRIEHCRAKGLPNGQDGYIQFLVLPVGDDIALVDSKTGSMIRMLRQDTGGRMSDDDGYDGLDEDAITAYALSSNDEMMITCSRNQLIRQYMLEDSSSFVMKTWSKSGHTLPVTRMAFHSSNVFLATASIDGSVRIWDVRGSYVTHVFRPYQGRDSGGMRSVTSLTWKSHDVSELVIAIGREDGSIAIHNLKDKDNENLMVLRDHMSAVTCMDWSPDNERYFVSTGRDSVINLWKLVVIEDIDSEANRAKKKGKKRSIEGARNIFQRIHTKPVYEQVEGLALLKSSNEEIWVVTAGSKGILRVWKSILIENKKPGFECIAEQPSSQCFGESRGGYMDLKLVSAAMDDGSRLDRLILADAEHNIQFISLENKEMLSSLRTIVGHNDEILDLKLLPSEKGNPTRAVVATNSSQVRIFEIATFSCDVLSGHSATVLCVDVSPCGRYIATASKDKTMRLWLASSSHRCIGIATGHTEAIGATALSRKVGRYDVSGKAAIHGAGSFVVTASKDRTLKRWNLPGSSTLDDIQETMDLTTFCSVRAHEKDINIVSIAPNDSLVATGSQDKMIKLWNANDLTLQATLRGHKRGVWDCQFSPFDRVLATCSGDKTVKLWSLNDYSCVRTFQGHLGSTLRVRFLTGGLQMISAGADGLLKLWTIRTSDCEATLDGHHDKIWAMDTTADGKMFMSGGADSQLLLWVDTTVQEQSKKREEEEKTILLEQQLANHLRYKEYEQALDLALELEKPRQILKVLTAITENDREKGETGLTTLQNHTRKWPMEKTKKILQYCRDWNTRARNCHVAMLVVQAIITTIPVHILASTDGMPELFAGITPYTERHFDRLDRLHTNAYLLDYTLFSMGVIEDDGSAQKNYAEWESKSKLILPPQQQDGLIQVGGSMIVATGRPAVSDESEDEILTIGESDSSDDESASD